MDPIRGYSADSDEEVVTTVNARRVRSVYLITYSQADIALVPTRDAFVCAVLEAFQTVGNSAATLVHWVCSKEDHHVNDGVHYHMAIKLSQPRRWLSVREYLFRVRNVNVNFSDRHDNYFTAWRYTTKEDREYIQSDHHPDLTNSEQPVTTAATESVRHYNSTSDEADGSSDGGPSRKRTKKNRLSVYDVSQIAVQKGIKTRLELMAFAKRQKELGKTDLAQFIANRGPRCVEEALQVGWEMEEAEENLRRSKLTRTEIIQEAFQGECIEGCHGQWLELAEDILRRNSIPKTTFAGAIRTLLEKGRGKYRNLFIKGPANCGKTLLLNPLNSIYRTFTNPATTTFAWVGAESAEVIFLNDFRWSAQILPWHDLLLLLEGQTVHLPAPKTRFARDLVFQADTPIFCTAKQELAFASGGFIDERETEMMRVRWRVFSFSSPIPEHGQRNVPSCGHRFARFILG